MAARAWDQSQRKSPTAVWFSHLLARQTLRLASHFHALQPHTNGTRAHKDNLVSCLLQLHYRLYQPGQGGQQWLVGRFMDDRRSACEAPGQRTSLSAS